MNSYILPSIAVSMMIIGVTILTPILVYYWLQFLRNAKAVTMKHKNKRLINYMMIWSIFGLVFEIPFIILCKIWKIHDFMNMPLWVISAIDSCYLALIFLFYSIYLWLLFYYRQYHIAIAEIAWKKAINARYRAWYIDNKHKFGDYHFIIQITIAPFIIYCVIQCVIEYILCTQNLTFHSIILLSIIFIIPSFCISFKLRHCSDIFDIKKEIRYQCAMSIVFVLIYLTEIVTDFMDTKQEIISQNDDILFIMQIQSLLISFSTMIILFFMALILIKFSSNQAKSLLNPWSNTWSNISRLSISSPKLRMTLEKANTVSCDDDTETERNTNNNHNINHNGSGNVQNLGVNGMIETLSDNCGFKAYMQHLTEEYATENLLFVLELVQIKYEFQLEHNVHMSQTNTPQRSRANSFTDNLQRISVIEEEFVIADIDMMAPIAEEEMEIIYTDNDNNVISPIPEMVIMDFENEMMDINPNDINCHKSPKMHTRASSVKDGVGASSFIHNSDGSVFAKIELPSGLPRSELLNTKHLFSERIYELYLKYIKPGSVHEINVSYYQRARITEAMRNIYPTILREDDDDCDDLDDGERVGAGETITDERQLDIIGYSYFNVMDGACIEILMLMVDSYKRFMITLGKST